MIGELNKQAESLWILQNMCVAKMFFFVLNLRFNMQEKER